MNENPTLPADPPMPPSVELHPVEEPDQLGPHAAENARKLMELQERRQAESAH